MIVHPYPLPEDPVRSPLAATGEDTAIDILSRTLWAEAHDESVRVKEAIAATVINRTRLALSRYGRDWWGTTIPEACLGGDHFPCWRRDSEWGEALLLVPPDDPMLMICRRIAARAVRGALADPTSGATHYHGPDQKPVWAQHLRAAVQIGDHRFYAPES